MPCKMTCIGVAASQGGPDNRGLRSGCRKQLARPLQADQSGKLHGRAAAKLAERTKKRPRSNARDRNEFFDRNQARPIGFDIFLGLPNVMRRRSGSRALQKATMRVSAGLESRNDDRLLQLAQRKRRNLR